MSTSVLQNSKAESSSSFREVRHCPCCGDAMIGRPVLKCAHCGAEYALRCFVYKDSKKRGYIAECVDLDILSQGQTRDEAIGKLQEAMYSYLEVAFSPGESTQGLVLRRSPLSHRLRYRLHRMDSWLRSFFRGERGKHFLLDGTKSPKVCHC